MTLCDPCLTDVLGREPTITEVDGSYLTGRRVLVTGAGGSIGSELCRQITRFDPDQLIMLDRDESALHALQLELTGRALLDDASTVLADIRDEIRIFQIMKSYRPDVVIHAAALKHQPLLQRYPGEAVKTNIWGTENVLNAADTVGTGTIINISSDKAAHPQGNMLGLAKRITEQLTAWHAQNRRFLSVRFGNVIGSRGSVIDTFLRQARRGEPVTVTHPEATRYMMSVREAIALALHAGAIGYPGEVLVLDMGQPVRIADVAAGIVRVLGSTSPIVYTGLRPGERLHETRLAADEPDCRPLHPLITQLDPGVLDPRRVREIDPNTDPEKIMEQVEEIIR